MKQSVWPASVTIPEFDPLTGDKKTEVLIIGGGLCGILCAYVLKQAGVDVILAEGNKIASGITQNTTAKITSQHGLVYGKMIRDFGKEKAQMYFKVNQEAVKDYETLCQNIECGFEKKPAYTYSLTDRNKIEEEVMAVNEIGGKAEFKINLELPFQTQGAVYMEEQAQFHPLKFIAQIANYLTIYENTLIRDIAPHVAVSDKGRIFADNIIVATHFPFINKHGSYFLKLYQHRSYVSAYENAQELHGMYVDEAAKGMSFRTYGPLLFIGGGGHRTGKQGGNWQELHYFAQKYYPDAELKYEWATQDCMSLDSIPYIGRYAKSTSNLYVATGFNKWGMTGSMVAAKILSDMVQGKENDYAKVFSPQRSILKPQLLVNGFEAAVNLLTPTSKRCPHLGCALKWNRQEHTWDCPCHGSRFENDGKRIDNPATRDANIK